MNLLLGKGDFTQITTLSTQVTALSSQIDDLNKQNAALLVQVRDLTEQSKVDKDKISKLAKNHLCIKTFQCVNATNL